jgi:YD repeat-containing protein
VVDFDYDARGRVVRQSFPDLRLVEFGYDEAGNLVSLTPPGRPAHEFEYDSRDRESRYEPPTVGAFDPATLFTYNAESQLTRVARPDGDRAARGDHCARWGDARVHLRGVAADRDALGGRGGGIGGPLLRCICMLLRDS